MGLFAKMHFTLFAYLFRFISLVMRQPFYNRFTEDFVQEHFQGKSGHLIFMGNAFVWGVIVWLICKRKGKQDACGLSQRVVSEGKETCSQ